MTDSFPSLFKPITLRDVHIRNRIVFTAHYTHLADRVPSPELIAYYESRARGGAGLIVVETAGVHESGSFESVIVAHNEACIPGYRGIAEACHSHDCRVFGQLFHPGRETRGRTDGVRNIAWAPSALPGDRHHVIPRAMPVSLIHDVVAGYGKSAGHLMAGGLDGIEILASQGYLLAEFLSPRINLREDAYGGDVSGRVRIILETIDTIRESIGSSKVLGIRLSSEARVPDGASGDEMLDICRALEAHGGLDYFSFVLGSSTSLGGSIHIVPPMEWDPAYVVDPAARLKTSLNLPVMVTGRINHPQLAERILSEGKADFCGMTRALIADPNMPAKTAAGNLEDIRACIGCNQSCVGHTALGYSVSCLQRPESGRELTLGRIAPAEKKRRVLVAGGGPAGLKAAAVAARRGHEVTLYESTKRLGGQVLFAEKLPSRAEFGALVTHLVRECEVARVNFVTQARVDASLVQTEAPDCVIVATGSIPHRPELPGAEEAHVVDALQVIDGTANVGSSVVIADWRNDWIGLGVAEILATSGRRVRLCVNGTHAGETLHMYVRDSLIARVHRLGVEIIPYARLFGVDEDTVYFQHSASDEPIVVEDTDTLVLSLGNRSDSTLEDQLSDFSGEIHIIGDCLAPRTAEEAIYDGLRVARLL